MRPNYRPLRPREYLNLANKLIKGGLDVRMRGLESTESEHDLVKQWLATKKQLPLPSDAEKVKLKLEALATQLNRPQ